MTHNSSIYKTTLSTIHESSEKYEFSSGTNTPTRSLSSFSSTSSTLQLGAKALATQAANLAAAKERKVKIVTPVDDDQTKVPSPTDYHSSYFIYRNLVRPTPTPTASSCSGSTDPIAKRAEFLRKRSSELQTEYALNRAQQHGARKMRDRRQVAKERRLSKAAEIEADRVRRIFVGKPVSKGRRVANGMKRVFTFWKA